GRSRSEGDDGAERPESAVACSLQDHLYEQLRLTRASERDCALVGLLIGELDDSGYLSTPLDDIADMLPRELDVEREELTTALRLLQSFDPPGVGAQSLSECLLIQLRGRRAQAAQDVGAEVLDCGQLVAEQHLPGLATGSLTRLRGRVGGPMPGRRSPRGVPRKRERCPAR